MNIKDFLISAFNTSNAGPFLFVGSGFSRRYLGLEDWKSLLKKYCICGHPFEYYLSTGDGTYPKAAELIAVDFNKVWWSSDEFSESRERFSDRITDSTSALRIEISQYLSKINDIKIKVSEYKKEIDLLSGLNVDGIITTNWDCFLEKVFPDYKVYTGQQELLFSNPQSIGEIYKIHGSCHRPKTLVLTSEDYNEFNSKNAYLASKLITIFVEHPVIFIGYSISDVNVSSLLGSISLCIGKDNINKLRRNLIFVQRLSEGECDSVSETYLTIDLVQIPIILVKTNDFSIVYEAIDAIKRKIPARVLRYCKEQLYKLVKSSEPEKKICVIDIDEIEKYEEVEFLVGVGVADEKFKEVQMSKKGYRGISILDLFSNLIFESEDLDANIVINEVITEVGKNTANVPIFKYMSALGIKNQSDYIESGLSLDKWICRSIEDFQVKSHFKSFVKNHKNKTSNEIIELCTPENAAIYIPFLKKEMIDFDNLRIFLVENFNKFEQSNSSYSSYYRKLACIYDRYKYGWF